MEYFPLCLRKMVLAKDGVLRRHLDSDVFLIVLAHWLWKETMPMMLKCGFLLTLNGWCCHIPKNIALIFFKLLRGHLSKQIVFIFFVRSGDTICSLDFCCHLIYCIICWRQVNQRIESIWKSQQQSVFTEQMSLLLRIINKSCCKSTFSVDTQSRFNLQWILSLEIKATS